MFIADPKHPGSRIRIFSIPFPISRIQGQKVSRSRSGSASKNLIIFNPKKFSQALGNVTRDAHPGSGSRIRILIFLPIPGFRIQGSKRHRISDPGSGLKEDVQRTASSVQDPAGEARRESFLLIQTNVKLF
jgi:hypothetical protein